MGTKASGDQAGAGIRISQKTGKPVRVSVAFTPARRARVLEEIAATCNITRAAHAAGVSVNTIYARKSRDPAFKEQLAQAVLAGYERIEEELLAHTLAGGGVADGEGDDRNDGSRGGRGTGRPGFDPDLALKVLAQRNAALRGQRGRNAPPIKRATEREIEDELVGKLKGLAKRLALIA